MLEDLDEWDSLVGVLLEELVDQVLVLLRDLRFELNRLTSLVPCDRLLIPSERCIAVDQLVEQDAKRPDVQLVVVLPMVDHLRCHVLECATEGVALALVELAIVVHVHLTFTRPAKVADLQHVVLVHEQVFWLQISMDEAVLVEEVDASDRLDEEIKCGLLAEALLLPDQGEQVALSHVLHDQVNVLVVLQVRIHSHDVYVLQFLMNLDLSPESLLHFGSFDHSLVKFFNSHFYTARLMQSELNLSVRAFAQGDALELELVKLHIGQHLLIRVGLAGHAQLACLDEWSRLLDTLDLSRVERGHDAASGGVLAPGALILMTHLPILVQTVMRAID